MEKKRIVLIVLLVLLPVIILFLIRPINPSELDDVTPEIPCSHELLKKTDTLWVIPKFNNTPISENREWCDQILALNKTLGLHGFYHTYQELNSEITQGQLDEAITIFEDCFHRPPKTFKPPQLKISKENKQLIENNGLEVKTTFNQITHKVYHCSDTGRFSNKFISYF
ncbi:MAG: DUF2334 domain-containing protein [archaeon]